MDNAIFSQCRKYRYRLDRCIDMFDGVPVGFCLHNPSVAGESSDDPTSRRGVGFARLWGCSHLIFVNVWAGIATSPGDLWIMEDPIGQENDDYISEAASFISDRGGFFVAAWGRIRPPTERRASAAARLKLVEGLIRKRGCHMMALGTNLDGSPKHPLYVRGETLPNLWTGD